MATLGKVKDELQAAIDMRAKIGIAHFGQNFESEAKTNLEAAKKWLHGAMLMAAVTVLVGIWFFAFSPNSGNIGLLVNAITTRLIVLSILVWSTVTAAKFYRINMHLAIMNNHRALSLSTFERFVASAKTEETKDAVLAEATKCIFSAGSSGYIDSKDDGPNIQLVDIVKAASGKG